MLPQIQETIVQLQRKSPLVHNITNMVVMQVCANTLLAAGASPLMAQAEEEMDDIQAIASALCLNIGTLDRNWLKSMHTAAKAAKKYNKAIVLDPVGAGASLLRTQAALELLAEARPDLLRGNASEIMALAAGERQAGSRGVDSHNPAQEACDAALALSTQYGCVVSVSGEVDYIISPKARLEVRGGSAMMTRVTGLGCSASALSAACLAVAGDSLHGAAAAMAMMAEAGEKAAAVAMGPGSFLPLFLDALYVLNPAAAAQRVSQC